MMYLDPLATKLLQRSLLTGAAKAFIGPHAGDT
jgi:hypothetical protein